MSIYKESPMYLRATWRETEVMDKGRGEIGVDLNDGSQGVMKWN